MLNKGAGNMYPWVTHTWNPIRGECPHKCSYCYMKRFPVGELRLDMESLKDDLGHDNTIFVGSSTDMWALPVPTCWIRQVLAHCNKYPDNVYLFQSKAPGRFLSSEFAFPPNVVFGTTIETDKSITGLSKAPDPWSRMMSMHYIENCRKMVSIEPILNFDLVTMVDWIKTIKPEFVSIGADSRGHNLAEPSRESILTLIEALDDITEVKVKPNLSRLIGKGGDMNSEINLERTVLPTRYYRGYRYRDVGALIVTRDGRYFSPRPSQKLFNHSPDGFGWGYCGSGAAQLALALLYDVTQDAALSISLHQKFKGDVVAAWQDKWQISSDDIKKWVENNQQNLTLGLLW